MKKILIVLLAVLLCICVAACVASANAQAADPMEQTPAPTTEAPILEPYTGPTIEIERPTLDVQVPSPDEMPTLPDGDFHIPPGERPGDQVEVYDGVITD